MLRLWGMFVVSGLIVQIVERRLELVFLDRYSGASSVAMYSVAFSLISIPTTLLGLADRGGHAGDRGAQRQGTAGRRGGAWVVPPGSCSAWSSSSWRAP